MPIESESTPRIGETVRGVLRSTVTRGTRRFARDEDGSLIIFGLFLFVLMLMISGMAIDLMRFETKRTRLQNTLDTAALSATNLNQTVDADAMVADFITKAGFDPALVYTKATPVMVGQDATDPNSGTLVAREVRAEYFLQLPTFFMDLLGVETLETITGSIAYERVQNVEISLVVDISGSMDGQKIADLKEAAKIFFRDVIDEKRERGYTSISIIPYNHAIVVPDALLSRLNTSGPRIVATPDPYTGALTAYPRTASGSKCVVFDDSFFLTNDILRDYQDLRRITPTQELDRMAFHAAGGNTGSEAGFARPADAARRCDPSRGAILPWETRISVLDAHIESLRADGWTAIDNGVKWATALLDPAMRPVVTSMVQAKLLEDKLDTRPGDYIKAETLKVIVLMTDGANTNQYDVRGPYKNGPSRIWFSDKASRDVGPNGEDWRNLYIVDRNNDGVADREKRWYDGIYVLMPGQSESRRFMRQHVPWNDSDAVHVSVGNLPDDAAQLDYTALYEQFSENAVAQFFRDRNIGDQTAYNAHRNADYLTQNNNSANLRMSGQTGTTESGICDIAKMNGDIEIFSIAFQAGDSAERVMRDCATDTSYFFNASNGAELRKAYAAIAGAINKLSLTQ